MIEIRHKRTEELLLSTGAETLEGVDLLGARLMARSSHASMKGPSAGSPTSWAPTCLGATLTRADPSVGANLRAETLRRLAGAANLSGSGPARGGSVCGGPARRGPTAQTWWGEPLRRQSLCRMHSWGRGLWRAPGSRERTSRAPIWRAQPAVRPSTMGTPVVRRPPVSRARPSCTGADGGGRYSPLPRARKVRGYGRWTLGTISLRGFAPHGALHSRGTMRVPMRGESSVQ
jgi:hypothetical protein